ncbi:MAG: hypothetical protein CVU06_08315 [Bacteroidetes bacterium HGW-Bacteroidetes-22]|nr:MAG: hypothetical protein CVU06_08315 [Bacteroidetes bacterium HGW-Bacteroidetes-22]
MCILLNAYRVNTKTVPGQGTLIFGFDFDCAFNYGFSYGFDGSIISLSVEIVVNKSSGWKNRRTQVPLTARFKQSLLAIDFL